MGFGFRVSWLGSRDIPWVPLKGFEGIVYLQGLMATL